MGEILRHLWRGSVEGGAVKVVYIAGPFRAANSWEREQNIRRAEEAALAVWRNGAAALCPHTNTRFFDGAAENFVWLHGDLEMLRRCDAVLTVAGWDTSIGAKAEIVEAVRVGLPVFQTVDDLRRFLED